MPSSYKSKLRLTRPAATPRDALSAIEPISSVSRSELIAALMLRKKARYVKMMRACRIGAFGATSNWLEVFTKTSNTDSMMAKRDACSIINAQSIAVTQDVFKIMLTMMADVWNVVAQPSRRASIVRGS